jgi:predicted O-methyltransferase YrrM
MDKAASIHAYAQKQAAIENHLTNIEVIIVGSGESLEGNSFYIHNSLMRFDQLKTKQLNLFRQGANAASRICEIGFNAGHSALLMLVGRPATPVEFTVFDIGQHAYTRPAIKYIGSQFPHVRINYIEGDSTMSIPAWIAKRPEIVHSYDLVHVDGGHSEHCIRNDLQNAIRLTRLGGVIVVDDTNISYVNEYVDFYITSGVCVELDVFPTTGYPHRILRKVSELRGEDAP